MLDFHSKPTDKFIKDYYAVLGQYGHLHVEHETAVRSAFQSVLRGYSKRVQWTLVPEYAIQKDLTHRIVVDAALLDDFNQRRGFWEAKDEHDDLEREIKRKFAKGYPNNNIIFQAPERAIIYQHGVRQGLNEDITDSKNLSDLLTHFFSYREPVHAEWEDAVKDFELRIPELAQGAQKIIEDEKKNNRAFRDSFESFYSLCRQSINPNLSETAVEKMLIQHLLTERIFRRVFHNEEFRSRNVIACEIEKVISSMTSRHFSRDQFLSQLDRFYKALERAADDKEDYSEKQTFLNSVYERFFQGFSPKEADTHGIVYTPQPIVDFMVRSVDDILKKEFGKSLADPGVHILDPFVGTGNFITRIIRQIGETRKSALPHKFEHELHCNEIMLLPYYIASMNIEHEYMKQTGQYKPFEGICLTDTFELAEPEQAQLAFMSEENTARVKKQKDAPIFVVIGNPPYNAWQENENDNNKNRLYPVLDKRVKDTYRKDSNSGLTIALKDPYVKAIRWASDRIGEQGIVSFVSNSSFAHKIAFDGMRKHLMRDFDCIYVLDLHGDIRKDSMKDGIPLGEEHTVFGSEAMVGVALSFLVRTGKGEGKVYYSECDFRATRVQKFALLDGWKHRSGVPWKELQPLSDGTWLTEGMLDEFQTFVPLGAAKRSKMKRNSVFLNYTNGVKTNRDAWAFNFNKDELSQNIRRTIEFFNSTVDRWQRTPNRDSLDIDQFVEYDEKSIAWSGDLKEAARSGAKTEFDSSHIRQSIYRPFSRAFLYFDRLLNNSIYRLTEAYPKESDGENKSVVLSDITHRAEYSAFCVDRIPEHHLCASTDSFQCFPFYTYDEDGSNRRENITDWALEEFRAHYHDVTLTKWDIFHYTYALLHSPEYRERYAANLKRELPRIPYAPDFRAFAVAGKELAKLHIHYEQQPEYPLQRIETPNAKLSYRVEKMRLGKDKSSLFYNDFLSLAAIPPETYEYRLGNRSALEWVIDQYQISTDKRSGITNDPNREDDPEYILRLIGQMVYLSLETVKIVKSLPELGIAKAATTHA